MDQQEILFQWREPTFAISRPNSLKQPIQLAEGRELRILELRAYVRSLTRALGFAAVLTCIAFALFIFNDPGSYWHKLGLVILWGTICGRFFVPILLRLIHIAFRNHQSQEITYQLSRHKIARIKDGSSKTIFHLSDIRRVLFQQIQYTKGSRWVLRIKHKSRVWFELGIPKNLGVQARRVFQELGIQFDVSSKPIKRWLSIKSYHQKEFENSL